MAIAPQQNFSTTRDILRFEGVEPKAYWRRFSMLLGLSVVIATMGLLRNSSAVVIAAMLIAPLMTPILGVAAAMTVGRSERALRLLGLVLLAAAASVSLAWFIVFLGDAPQDLRPPEQVRARTDPGTEDLIVALAAGIAGAYVQINRNEISLLPGAAIGVSLVPPLCAAGVLLYGGHWDDAYEAVLLFLTNLAAIVFSACGVYMFYGGRIVLQKKGKRRKNFTMGFVATLVVLSVIAVQLLTATFQRYQEARAEAELARVIQVWADPVSVEVVRINVQNKRRHADIWVIVDLPFEAQNRVAAVSDLLPQSLQDRDLAPRLEAVLGSDYDVAFRFQIRYAGLVDLRSERVTDAPAVDEETADE